MICDRIDRNRAGGRPAGKLCRFVALVALAALPAPLAAQYGQPSAPRQDVPRPTAPDQAPEPATQAEVLRGAVCQVGRDAASVEPLLATAPYSAAERTQAVRLLRLIQRCLRARDPIATSAALLRGAAAEALYESRFPAAQAAPAPALTVQPLLRPDQAADPADAATLAPAFALAECTSSRHGALVRGLLGTEPGGPEAQAAFQALNPAFVSCVSGDARIAVDGRTLRGMLAETLYRWSVVQRDGATSPLAAAAAAATP